MKIAAQACRAGFGQLPAFLRSGGTIGVVNELARLGIFPVLLGLSLPDDRAHAPNEKYELATFHRAIETSIAFFSLMGQS
jgi:acetylornithine deacetylase/succinyl-diaminopimelate desuccinylase-like protein